MSDRFKTAEEARILVDALNPHIHDIPYNRDLKKMHSNLYDMISHISQLEVEDRRRPNRNHHKATAEKIKLEAAMKHLEQLLLIAKLMK